MNDTQLIEKIQQIFTHLHEHPEVSWKENQTTSYIKDFLENEGLKPQIFSHMTGLYVDIGEGTPQVGFRTDMDALWQEVNGTFQANHSCCHDGHMTVALGTVLKLKEIASTLPGAVRIIFQPAEELGNGAKTLAEQGVVEPLDYLFGMHVRPLIELDDDTYAPAIYHGAAKHYTGKIIGTEVNGARTEEGVNAIEVATALVDGTKRISIRPTETTSIKLAKLQAGGESSNIIPGNATFSIDSREQNNETMEALTVA